MREKSPSMRTKNFTKSFLYYFRIITIPILGVFMIYALFIVNGRKQEIQKNTDKAVEAVRDSFLMVLSNADMQYDILARNPRLSISLRNYLAHSKSGYMDSVLVNSILTNFSSLTNNAPYIASVYYYLDGYEGVLSSSVGAVQRLEDFEDVGWLASYEKHDGGDRWLERRMMRQYPYASPTPVLTYYRKLGMFRGVVVVNLYEERLRELLDAGSRLDHFFIVDENGDLLLSSGDGEFYERNRGELFGVEQTWIRDSRKKYYACSVLAGENASIIACLNHSSYYEAIYALWLQFFLMLVAVMGISLWISYAITRKNFRRIDYFIELFANAERGEYGKAKPDFVQDEYDVILHNIIQLFLSNTFLQNQLALGEEQQKLAELKALQLQINPHFLFNTLQTVDLKMLEYTGRPTSANRMIEALSDLLKYSLESPNTMVTLKDEIGYLKKYDSIQRYRYADKYILYYEYKEELDQIPMMRLILQPLIENSLYHGIKPLEGSGCIKLKVFRRNGFIWFFVVDSGVGMTRQEVEELYEKIQSSDSKHIGLTNVNSRLIMRYGREAGLRIQSKKGLGTCISFKIPETQI